MFYNYYLDIFITVTFLLLVAMVGVILLAVDFNYREDRGGTEVVFEEDLRLSLHTENVIWFNVEIYGKLRKRYYLNPGIDEAEAFKL
jgi:hypothetical protein